MKHPLKNLGVKKKKNDRFPESKLALSLSPSLSGVFCVDWLRRKMAMG